jgi:hypothetical protein
MESSFSGLFNYIFSIETIQLRIIKRIDEFEIISMEAIIA